MGQMASTREFLGTGSIRISLRHRIAPTALIGVERAPLASVSRKHTPLPISRELPDPPPDVGPCPAALAG